MAAVRPFEREDLPGVAALLRRHPPGTVDLHEHFLSATLLDDPWADPELPSLVAVSDEGRTVGFIGAHVRRLKLGERELRGVCCSHLVVEPDSRRGATAVTLLRRLLSGPQELTWSDTANDVMLRMWKIFGGWSDHTRGCDWMLALHPARWAASAVAAVVGRRAVRRDLVPVGALPLQAAGPRLLRRAYPALEAEITGEPATAAAIADCAATCSDPGHLRPAHDSAYLEHVFGLLDRTAGGLVRRVVRREGRPVGWYAYVDRGGAGSRVLHLAARDAHVEAVVGELVRHARASGRSVLSGRFEPNLEEPLRRRLAVLGLARRPVMHSRDDEVRGALAAGAALITQLDGEWYVL